MARRGWICDGCNAGVVGEPWKCPTCRNETCGRCCGKYAHCNPCSEKYKDDDLIHAANSQGWEFEAEAGKVGHGEESSRG